MNFTELFEGATPKLPGAVGGIKVMSMDQFLAQSGDEPEEKIDEMSSEELDKMSPEQLAQFTHKARSDKSNIDPKTVDQAYGKSISIMFPDSDKRIKQSTNHKQQNVNEADMNRRGFLKGMGAAAATGSAGEALANTTTENIGEWRVTIRTSKFDKDKEIMASTTDLFLHWKNYGGLRLTFSLGHDYNFQPNTEFKYMLNNNTNTIKTIPVTISNRGRVDLTHDLDKIANSNVLSVKFTWQNPTGKFGTTSERDIPLNGISNIISLIKKQGLSEATKLPAQTRELKGQELEDYLDRIRNREKGKTDKYKLPYIHRSSVVKYYNEEGKRYDTDQIKTALGVRPKKLLKQNEKMKHSNGELEQFFNIGFAALVGIALDEGTNELIVVNTCPGAGSCKIECFAMKGGKVQFEGPWLSDGRILTFLLNDPDGFFNQLSGEITKEEKLAQKGGYNLTIRWHDAGDFFSPEYMDMAFKLAAAHPDVKFYAYTKIADAALGQKPSNFIINWSEGASTSQEKQVKQQDPQLDVTKNSRIVPSKLFYDLLKKDKDGKLDKTADGAWQPRDEAALEELKDRLANQYNLKRDSIIDYNEMMATPQKNNIKKWNVIIAPGEGDISANRQDVLSTLLLKH